MPEWERWVPLETLRALTHHAIGNTATVLYLVIVGGVVKYLMPDDFLKTVVLEADEFLVALVFAHLFAHFVVYLWKTGPWFKGPTNVFVLA